MGALRVKRSRHAMKRSSDLMFRRVKHEIRVPLTDGSQWNWVVMNPARLLAIAVETSPDLSLEYARAAARKMPSRASPWSLIVGFDEFSPGSKLKVDNRRKCQVLSISFLELGHRNLQHDLCWLPCAVVRTTIIRKAVGGWSAMLKMFLLEILCGAEGFSTAGAALTIGGWPYVLFANMHYLIS